PTLSPSEGGEGESARSAQCSSSSPSPPSEGERAGVRGPPARCCRDSPFGFRLFCFPRFVEGTLPLVAESRVEVRPAPFLRRGGGPMHANHATPVHQARIGRI